MTKVALINPGNNPKFAIEEPLGLGFIASYLELNGIKVKIIDELAGQDVEGLLREFSPDIAGITITTPLANHAYKIAGICKDMGILTVLGGVHPHILAEEAQRHADIVVQGEGEPAMLKIIREGITSGIVSCEYIKDLDAMPHPARHLMDMDFYMYTKDRLPYTYLYFVPAKTRVAAMLTGRGCPHRCIFCHNSWRSSPYRFNSPERVIAEIEELVKVYGIKALFFIEDTLFVNKPRLLRICELIRDRGIKIIWGGNARVNEIDKDTLKAVKEAGCRQITFGFESGSQKILDILKKDTTVRQNKEAVGLCRKFGIIPQGTFMIGNPSETKADIIATQQFIRENNIEGAGVCVTTPYPGTELWDWCQKNKRIPENLSWDDLLFDKVVISCSEEFSCSELADLYRQTADIADLKWRIGFSEVSRTYLLPLWKLPLRLVKAVRHPAHLSGFIRQMRKLKI
ncbi:radical SAM protein [bacterium]|nr:MAG: radical SAM protein [bacterium]